RVLQRLPVYRPLESELIVARTVRVIVRPGRLVIITFGSTGEQEQSEFFQMACQMVFELFR
ncbi:MAG: hypothetical protein Q9173_005482, partial [Seirophora scorigena]